MKDVFIATSNEGKVERFENLLKHSGLDVHIHTPRSLSLGEVEVEESGKTLSQNAHLKAQAYFGKVDMPILAHDAGFWVESEGFVDAPKRKALGDKDERALSKNELATILNSFWKDIATKNGGSVDAAWVEAFVLLDTDGSLRTAESKREVLLTNVEHGDPHIQMPIRCLYIAKATNKPAIQHTQEEELIEMAPVVEALRKLLE